MLDFIAVQTDTKLNIVSFADVDNIIINIAIMLPAVLGTTIEHVIALGFDGYYLLASTFALHFNFSLLQILVILREHSLFRSDAYHEWLANG